MAASYSGTDEHSYVDKTSGHLISFARCQPTMEALNRIAARVRANIVPRGAEDRDLADANDPAPADGPVTNP